MSHKDNDEKSRESKKPSEEEPQEVKLVRVIPKQRKPRLKPPTALERVFGKKDAVKDRYFTAGPNINESNRRDVHAEASPFKYPEDLEEFSYKVMSKAWRDTRRREEMKLKYNERHSHRTRQNVDKLNRLWVKPPDVGGMKTVLDLDPEFFTLVEGRPVPQKLSHKDYIQHLRDVLRTKIVTGYREDEILLIEEKLSAEQKEIDRIKVEFQRYVNSFEEFLYSDHTTSMALLKEAEQEAQVAAEKFETFRELSKNYGLLKSIVYNLEEKWRNCKMYQKFLYLISPIEWRKIHDFYLINKCTSAKMAERSVDTSVFGRYKLSITGDIRSLENLIDQFLEDINIQSEPQLYFSDPQQLLKVFSFIELQNLNSLLHSEELAIPLERVKEGMQKIHEKFNSDMTMLQEVIDSLEGGIVWEEERAKYLEELAQELIHGDFKELISNENVINLHVFVEDVYESRIAPNDSNLTMSDMMKLIETSYRNSLLQLDRLPANVVHRAEMECYADEARIMAIAKNAAKKVVQVERLMKHLSRILEPPTYKQTKDLKWRTAPKNKVKKPPPPPKPLTSVECDHLTYFVDFCEHIDDPKDFGIRVHPVPKNATEKGSPTQDQE